MVKCDVCGEERATVDWRREHLPIQMADDVLISAMPTVPVITCESCGERYTDERAEGIREETLKTIRAAFDAGRLKGLALHEPQ